MNNSLFLWRTRSEEIRRLDEEISRYVSQTLSLEAHNPIG